MPSIHLLPSARCTVNPATLADLEQLGSSPAFMGKLIGMFVADGVALVARMESALGGGNVDEFRNHLHAMKGSAASMGAERLAAFCGDTARLPDAEIRLRTLRLLESVREELAAARAVLEHYLVGRQEVRRIGGGAGGQRSERRRTNRAAKVFYLYKFNKL